MNTLILTILNWVVMFLLWILFASKMRKAKELELSASDRTDPTAIKKNKQAHFAIGLIVMSIVFGFLGAIIQKYINNL